MKAKFEFDLPEDQYEYEVMSQAHKMKQALWDITEALRSWDKYGHDFQDPHDAVRRIREEVYKILNHYEVNINL